MVKCNRKIDNLEIASDSGSTLSIYVTSFDIRHHNNKVHKIINKRHVIDLNIKDQQTIQQKHWTIYAIDFIYISFKT